MTDDYPALQAQADKGGDFVSPAGSAFSLSRAILLPPRTRWRSDTPGVPFTVTALPGINAGASNHLVANAGFAHGNDGVLVDTDIALEDINFDGNGANNMLASQRQVGAVLFNGCYAPVLRRVGIKNASSHGLHVVGAYSETLWPGPDVDWIAEDVTIDLNGPGGCVGVFPIRAEGASGGTIIRPKIGLANTVRTNDAIAPPGCSNMVVRDAVLRFCGDGINMMGADNAWFYNIDLADAGGIGIAIFQNPTTSRGCSNVNAENVTMTRVAKAGFRFPGSCSGFSLTNCQAVGLLTNYEIEASEGTLRGCLVDFAGAKGATGFAFLGNGITADENVVLNGGDTTTRDFVVHAPIDRLTMVRNSAGGLGVPFTLVGSRSGITNQLIQGNAGFTF